MIHKPPVLIFKKDIIDANCPSGQSIIEEMHKFPFSTKLSFKPMIKYWENLLENGELDERVIAREVFNQLDKYPFFNEPIEDETILEEHQDVVNLLLSGFFPSIQRKNLLGAAHKPFFMQPFFRTPAMIKFMGIGF